MENPVWQDDFKDKQGNTRYEIKYDCISPTIQIQIESLPGRHLEGSAINFAKSPRTIYQRNTQCRQDCSSSFLRKILTHTRTLINIYIGENEKKEKKRGRLSPPTFSGRKHGGIDRVVCFHLYAGHFPTCIIWLALTARNLSGTLHLALELFSWTNLELILFMLQQNLCGTKKALVLRF